MRCLFGHKWDEKLLVFEEPPRPPLRDGRWKLEAAMSYNQCVRCGTVEISEDMLLQLNARISRARMYAYALKVGQPFFALPNSPY